MLHNLTSYLIRSLLFVTTVVISMMNPAVTTHFGCEKTCSDQQATLCSQQREGFKLLPRIKAVPHEYDGAGQQREVERLWDLHRSCSRPPPGLQSNHPDLPLAPLQHVRDRDGQWGFVLGRAVIKERSSPLRGGRDAQSVSDYSGKHFIVLFRLESCWSC